MNGPEVIAEIALDSGMPVVSVKFSAPTYELNVFFNGGDVETLLTANLPLVPEERALCFGESCGAPAHWSCDNDGNMSIVMGFDDTTWDFGAWMPVETLQTVKAAVKALQPQLKAGSGE